ncbi:MAG TPA: TadE/TadG family type IV pilus assembly protein [Afifellaceae bacterium]|nr:TadE/TadG family type IV pilus assembly protein [Afifellaceae bacterium]
MRRLTSLFRRFGRNEDGGPAIEFAIIAPVFITVCLGVISLGYAFQVRNEMAHAVDAGIRQVMMDPDITDADLETAIKGAFQESDPANLTVTLTNLTINSVNYRSIAVSYPFTRIVIPGMPSDMALSLSRRTPLI